MSLKSQIFDCLPAGQYAFGTLLKLVDIVETDQIQTAAIECTNLPRLLINPEFVSNHANTSGKLFALTLHELYHVLLGHTRRFKRVNQIDNFVFDCVINALICRQFPDEEFTSLFTDFYSEAEFPTCLLRPPPHWDGLGEKIYLPLALKKRFSGYEQVRAIYRSLYSSDGVTYQDLYELLPKLILEVDSKDPKGGRGFRSLDQVPLLGEHREESSSLDNSESAFHQALSEIVRKWPCPPKPMKGQSLDGFLSETQISLEIIEKDKNAIAGLISKLAVVGHVDDENAKFKELNQITQSPIRPSRFSRRDTVSLCLGFSPLLYEVQSISLNRFKQIEPIHIYLDVSGSVDLVLPALCGAVLQQGKKIHEKIHLFSTEVHDVSPKDLRNGKIKSTGGTDINCVAKHLREHKVSRALIVTDGFVGSPAKDLRDVLSRVKMAVAYTPLSSKSNLKPFITYEADLLLDGGKQ